MKQYINFMENLIKQAGKLALERFGNDGIKKTKADKLDFLTEADLIINKLISDAIRSTFPEHGIISEEAEEHQNGSEYTWIIDPIDGTNNFATNVPLFGVMIALMHDDDLMISGIYLPITDEYFFAEKGKGAFLNGRPIHCSQKTDWPETWGVSSSRFSPSREELSNTIHRAAQSEMFMLSLFGCAAIAAASVACGRRDWLLSHGGKIWDKAPAILLLKEAGCKVTDFEGNPSKPHDKKTIAANPILHDKLLKLLKESN